MKHVGRSRLADGEIFLHMGILTGGELVFKERNGNFYDGTGGPREAGEALTRREECGGPENRRERQRDPVPSS